LSVDRDNSKVKIYSEKTVREWRMTELINKLKANGKLEQDKETEPNRNTNNKHD